jgi:hypothetical protein
MPNIAVAPVTCERRRSGLSVELAPATIRRRRYHQSVPCTALVRMIPIASLGVAEIVVAGDNCPPVTMSFTTLKILTQSTANVAVDVAKAHLSATESRIARVHLVIHCLISNPI